MTVLTRTQVAQYAAQAGFSGNALTIALAVAQAESSYSTEAINHNTNGSTDYGLWQINSIHGYSSSQLLNSPLYNAQAAYKISSGGTNWQPWSTFNSGAYLRYMPGGVGVTPAPAGVQSAKSNTYPQGQCTWYANQRYHDLAGYYVPWSANARDWAAKASQYGWHVSNSPSVPSIICLAGGVQGADATYGHVAVVEKINSDGSVTTTDQNWGLTAAARARTSTVVFKPGSGVTFITAGQPTGAGGTPGPAPVSSSGLASDLGNFFGAIGALFGGGVVNPAETVLEQVHQTLTDNPGFYGIALALDEIEEFPGYQNLATGPFDVIGMIRSIGASIGDNFVPFSIRGGLVSMGVLILMLLIVKVVLEVGEQAESLLPLLAAA